MGSGAFPGLHYIVFTQLLPVSHRCLERRGDWRVKCQLLMLVSAEARVVAEVRI